MFVRCRSQACSQIPYPPAGHQGRGENHHIGSHLDLPVRQGVGPPHPDPLPVLKYPGHPASQVNRILLLHCLLKELLIVLAVRPDVHVKDIGLPPFNPLFVKLGLFGRLHTTDPRAVWHIPVRISRGDALDKDDFLRDLPIGGSANLPLSRPSWTEHPLKSEPVNHVGDLSVSVFSDSFQGKKIIPRCDHNSPDVFFDE